MHALIRPRRAAALLWLAVAGSLMANVPVGPRPVSARVALVPLDDRPQSLQDPVLVGAVADVDVVTPPRIDLGRFLKTGNGDAIARWLDELDLSTIDAVVISADMLAYGGLVGSRVPRVFEAEGRRRLEAIARLKARRADLRVYVFSTIPRLALTSDGNDASRQPLARWGEIAPGVATDPALAAEAAAIERELPTGALDRYRATRDRNRALNLALVEAAARGAIDYLVFGEDDETATGLHVSDREAIARAVETSALGDRVRLHPGVDELGSLLLTRAVLTRLGHRPTLQPVYSSQAGSTLAAALASHAQVAGARLADRGDLQVFVYSSRHDTPDLADTFAARVAKAVAAQSRVVVADVDVKAADSGSSLPFIEGLRSRKIAPRLFAYASGDAGRAFGAALSQGLLFSAAVDTVAQASRDAALRVAAAQVHALLSRLVTDFLYQGVVRRQATEDFLQPRGLSAQRLDESGRARVEKYLLGEIKPLAESVTADFSAAPWRLPARAGQRPATGLTVKDLEGFAVSLPWGRMAEADITFGVTTQPLTATPHPPAPRVLQHD